MVANGRRPDDGYAIMKDVEQSPAAPMRLSTGTLYA